MEWVDKPEAKDLVSMMLQDITFRVELEDVAEIPQMFFHPPVKVKLPTKIRRQYDELRKHSQLLVEQGAINAVNAGARAQKMAQLLSGAVYDGEGGYVDLHTDRHKLVLDLAEEAEHSLVAFHWKHQRAGLEKEATRRGISYAVIDGSTSVKERETIIEKFKEGEYRVVFGHPLSIGHGLTLTRATRVIWASPTTRADIFEQFIHRVRRIGQDKKTEVLMITAENTIEDRTYETLVHRKETMTDYLYLVSALQQEAA
jgi:superfamily II DNA or RNA helicase